MNFQCLVSAKVGQPWQRQAFLQQITGAVNFLQLMDESSHVPAPGIKAFPKMGGPQKDPLKVPLPLVLGNSHAKLKVYEPSRLHVFRAQHHACKPGFLHSRNCIRNSSRSCVVPRHLRMSQSFVFALDPRMYHKRNSLDMAFCLKHSSHFQRMCNAGDALGSGAH